MSGNEVTIIPEFLNMPELLLCGVGNTIIYDKMKRSSGIDLDGKQRSGNDWGSKDRISEMLISILNEEPLPEVYRK